MRLAFLEMYFPFAGHFCFLRLGIRPDFLLFTLFQNISISLRFFLFQNIQGAFYRGFRSELLSVAFEDSAYSSPNWSSAEALE